MPFIVSPKPKAIINGAFILKFHDNVHSKILLTLISNLNNSYSIKLQISTILIFSAFGSKKSYTDKHLYSESENDHSDIVNPKQV